MGFQIKDRYICPFTDFGFKKIFGVEPNKDLLMDFLNELLCNDEEPIVDLTYLPTEQLGIRADERKAIFDIYCETENGEKIIVELQKAKQNFFKDRSIYYSSFPIQQQGEKGDWNFELKSVYTIGILDFIFDEDKDDHDVFHHEVQLVDKTTQKVFYDKLTYIYLEMPKYNKAEKDLETHFDKWLYVLKNLHNLTSRPKKLQEKIFSKLFDVAEIVNYSKTEYDQYQESLKVYRDMNNVLHTAFDEGEIKGHAEGLAEGEVKGRVKTALNMLHEGFEIEVVSRLTGFSIEEIKKMRE